MKRLRGAFAAVALAACAGEDLAFEEFSVTASRTSGWAGSEIILTSAAFTGADTVPLIIAGAETLAVRAVNAESIAVRLPSAGGVQDLAIRLSGGGAGVVPGILVYGLLSAEEGPAVDGRFVPVPGQGNPTAIARGSGARLVRVDLQSMSVFPLGAAADTGYLCFSGVVPTAYDPTIITAARTPGCSISSLRLTAPLSITDSAGVVGLGYSGIALGGGRWLRAFKPFIQVTTGPGTGYTEDCFGTFGFVTAPPTVGVTIPALCHTTAGVPVFDVATAQIRYRLPFHEMDAGAFSTAGDTLFALSRHDQAVRWTLFAVSAANGTVLDSLAVPFDMARYYQSAVAIDPNGPWLFVASGSETPGPNVTLRIFDRMTWQLVGEAHASSDVLDGTMFDWSIVVGADRVLYLIANYDGYVQPQRPAIYRFSLPPS